jgi:hypothetical protein
MPASDRAQPSIGDLHAPPAAGDPSTDGFLPQTCSMLDNTLGRRRRVGAALTRSQSPALHLLIRLAAALVDDFGVAAH